MTVPGLLLGAAGTVALTRVIGALLHGVSPLDPLTYVVVGVLLAGATLLACLLPARRAVRESPMLALRHD
jgi:putative ABC transport system permease protein